MIPLGPKTSTAGTTYTAAQVQGILMGPSLQMRWLFDLLGSQLQYKADLTPLVDLEQPAKIDYDTTRAVKRQLTIRMRPSAAANTLQDLVRVRYRVRTSDGGEVEWVIGTFMLTPPQKTISEGFTWWSITAPDLSQLLVDAAFSASTSVRAGINYAAAVTNLVQGYGGVTPLYAIVPDPNLAIAQPRSWDAGSSRLAAANDLLAAMSYTTLYARDNTFVTKPVPDWTTVLPIATFDTTTGLTQILGPLSEAADYSKAYNQFLVTGQDPRQAAVSYYYENRRADSPVSIERWHPRLLKVSDTALTSTAMCQARAMVEAQAAARVYSNLTIGTVPFPFFEDQDVIAVAYRATDEGLVRNNYVIVSGSHTCHPSTATTGVLQRIVAA
jgi:hypothetical protein